MDWVRHGASRREFDCFAAQAWDPLWRAGYLMTGDAKDAEDLVQETLLKVARRWNRVRAMDHPAAYARRILINLVLHDAGRRSRQRTELWPQDGAAETADEQANGTATLTIHPGVVLDSGTLQNDLRQYGIAAIVTTGSFCSSDPTPPGFSQVVTGQKQPRTLTINPAAMPAGTELSFGNFRVSAGPETAIQLIDTSSYTCTSTAPAAAPPGGIMVGPASVSMARPGG
jgi:hypothetical protein